MHNQYLVRVPTFGLKQPFFITRGVPIQQTTTTTLHVNVFVTIELHVYGNGVPIQ